MSGGRFESGCFVWTAFPARENPARPGPRHIGYVVLATRSAGSGAIFVAYTTSQPWTGTLPPGVYRFERQVAAHMGQARAFTLDLRRIAALPETVSWFPDLTTDHGGVVGRAPEPLRLELEKAATTLFRRSPEAVERLGPAWPGGQR